MAILCSTIAGMLHNAVAAKENTLASLAGVFPYKKTKCFEFFATFLIYLLVD